MPIEYAVLLAIPAVSALWAGALCIGAVITDIRKPKHLTKRFAAPRSAPQRTGRHRLVETGRHHLRPTPAHAG